VIVGQPATFLHRVCIQHTTQARYARRLATALDDVRPTSARHRGNVQVRDLSDDSRPLVAAHLAFALSSTNRRTTFKPRPDGADAGRLDLRNLFPPHQAPLSTVVDAALTLFSIIRYGSRSASVAIRHKQDAGVAGLRRPFPCPGPHSAESGVEIRHAVTVCSRMGLVETVGNNPCRPPSR